MKIPKYKAIYSNCEHESFEYETYVFEDGITVTMQPTLDSGLQVSRRRAFYEADFHEWVLTFDGEFQYRRMTDFDTMCHNPQEFVPVPNPEGNPICRVLQIWVDMYKKWALDAG